MLPLLLALVASGALAAQVPTYPPNDAVMFSGVPYFNAPADAQLFASPNDRADALKANRTRSMDGFRFFFLDNVQPQMMNNGMPNIQLPVAFGVLDGWEQDCELAIAVTVQPEDAAHGPSTFIVRESSKMKKQSKDTRTWFTEKAPQAGFVSDWVGNMTRAALAEEHDGLSYEVELGVTDKAKCYGKANRKFGPYAIFGAGSRFHWVSASFDAGAQNVLYSELQTEDLAFAINATNTVFQDRRGVAFYFNSTLPDNVEVALYLQSEDGKEATEDIDVHVTLFQLDGKHLVFTEQSLSYTVDEEQVILSGKLGGAEQATIFVELDNPQTAAKGGNYDMAVVLNAYIGSGKAPEKTKTPGWVVPVVASAGAVVVLGAIAFAYVKLRTPSKDAYQAF